MYMLTVNVLYRIGGLGVISQTSLSKSFACKDFRLTDLRILRLLPLVYAFIGEEAAEPKL